MCRLHSSVKLNQPTTYPQHDASVSSEVVCSEPLLHVPDPDRLVGTGGGHQSAGRIVTHVQYRLSMRLELSLDLACSTDTPLHRMCISAFAEAWHEHLALYMTINPYGHLKQRHTHSCISNGERFQLKSDMLYLSVGPILLGECCGRL